MKFTMTAKDLSELVSAGASVAPTRTSLDVIRNMMIEAKGGKVVMLATDMKVSIRKVATSSDIAIQEEGNTLLDAVKMLAVCGELRDKKSTIEFSSDGSGATIKCGRKRFQVYGQSPDDFPAMDFLGKDKPSQIDVDAEELKEMISRTSFASSTEANRYAMQGVLLDIIPGEFRLVATDSKRLAFTKRDRDLVKERVSGMIPSKGISVLMKMIPDDGIVSLNLTEKSIHFRTVDGELLSHLLEGVFPPYDGIIPKWNEDGIIIDREELADMVRAAAVMNTRESMATTFVFNKDKITFGSKNDGGEANSELEVNSPYENEVEVDLNPGYVLDVLRAMQSTNVSVRIKDAKSPIMFVEKDKLTYVVMPMGRKPKEKSQESKAAS